MEFFIFRPPDEIFRPSENPKFEPPKSSVLLNPLDISNGFDPPKASFLLNPLDISKGFGDLNHFGAGARIYKGFAKMKKFEIL